MSSIVENTKTTPDYYEPETVAGNLEQHKLRVLIDEVATLRGLTIQLALRLMALAAAANDDERSQLIDEYRALQSQFSKNLEKLFGSSPPGKTETKNIEWIKKIAGKNTERRRELLEVEADIQTTMKSLEKGKTPTFSEARAFFDRNWPVIRERMTEVIWDLWADLDTKKNEAMENNQSLQMTLTQTLTDIKKFSTAIRMIAINTAVLASRPQESGAGFQAISQEVKALSEDIEASATRANETIVALI